MAFFKMCLADNLQDATDCEGLPARQDQVHKLKMISFLMELLCFTAKKGQTLEWRTLVFVCGKY
jgi:hypothetical protein